MVSVGCAAHRIGCLCAVGQCCEQRPLAALAQMPRLETRSLQRRPFGHRSFSRNVRQSWVTAGWARSLQGRNQQAVQRLRRQAAEGVRGGR